MMTTTPQSKKGFVILFAILISAIILLIGVGIFRITVKETILSSAARESTIAFFAADGGMECALRHANRQSGFLPGTSPMECAGQLVSYTPSTSLVTNFKIELPEGCAAVNVDKAFTDNGNIAPHTQIIARGYNVCDGDSADTSDPLLLERVLEIRYPN